LKLILRSFVPRNPGDHAALAWADSGMAATATAEKRDERAAM
jgi:hypothetical protein